MARVRQLTNQRFDVVAPDVHHDNSGTWLASCRARTCPMP